MFSLDPMSSKLLYSTVMIVATLANGEESTGTAFFLHFKIDDQRQIPVLVTNKHVVANATSIKFVVHEAIKKADNTFVPNEKSFSVELDGLPWIEHPGNVDLCAIPFEPLRQQASSQGKEIFYIPLEEVLIPLPETTERLAAIEEIVMVGYPIGLWDRSNNFPVIRKGITASHPDTDFNGQPIGVVDVASFPGSSGSPIVILNEGSFSTPSGISIGSRIIFLGVLFAGPQITTDGKIEIVDIPTRKVPVARTNIPVHLGYYIKAKELIALKNKMISAFNLK